MDFEDFTVGENDNGRRLDRVVRKFLSDENLPQLYKALRKGLIKVNEKKQKEDYRINSDDKINIASFLINKEKKEFKKNIPPLLDEWIILRTEDLLILNKPYDLNVQKAKTDEISLDEIVQRDYEKKHTQNKSLSFKTGPLHRLDKKTTGLIVFSQSLKGAQWFTNSLKKHEIIKTYLAIIEGKLSSENFWSDNITKAKQIDNYYTVKVNECTENSRDSLTKVIPLGYGKYKNKDVTLAKFIIYTGRTHQIRSVSAYHGYPLLGDTAYGGTKINEIQDFFLHSFCLEFKENDFNITKKIICNPQNDFAEMLTICGLELQEKI